MPWLVQAFSISTPNGGALYTAIDPLEFYEWRFNQSIPKGAIFTEKLPRSDIFTEGKVIASVQLPQNALKKKSFGYELQKDTEADVTLTVGQIASPMDLVNRFDRVTREFNESIKQFKLACRMKKFLTSLDKKPHLYFVEFGDDTSANVTNYGIISDVRTLLQEARQEFKKPVKKTGRSYEMEGIRRFENYMTEFDNHLPLDASKFQFVLKAANIKPDQRLKMNWKDLYIKTSLDAYLTNQDIQAFNSLSWVKSVAKYS